MTDDIRDWLESLELGPGALLLLFLGALLEYVFPPFPGDTVILAGAFLVGSADWNPGLVFASVWLGSVVGMLIDYEAGRWMAQHDATWRGRFPWWRRFARKIDPIRPLLERQAGYYLLLNRFFPSIRAFFFIAAGFANVPRWKVVVFGGLSALVWCLILFGVGVWLGSDWERLLAWFATFTRFGWAVVGLLVLVALIWFVRGRPPAMRKKSAGGTDKVDPGNGTGAPSQQTSTRGENS